MIDDSSNRLEVESGMFIRKKVRDRLGDSVKYWLPPGIYAKLTKRRRARNEGALGDLDTLLSPYLNFRGGYFVELGANDGL